MAPVSLADHAFRSKNGELGWTRDQIPIVVEALRSQRIGILGGELWWVLDGAASWNGLIPQRHGPPAVYSWNIDPRVGESWDTFVERSASDTLAAVERWPGPQDLPDNLTGRILYNLTFSSEFEDQIRGSV